MYRSRWGLQVRAVVANRTMSEAVGIDTRRIDRLTFGLGCGIAGIAGSAFTMIGSTSPTAGQLYIVDTFLVVVFGGAQSLLGTIASALTISQSQSTLEFFTHGSMAKVLTLAHRHRAPDVASAGAVRPQGQKVTTQMSAALKNNSQSRAHRLRPDRGPDPGGVAAAARQLPPQPRRQVPDLRLRRRRPRAVLGLHRHPEPRPGRLLRSRRLLHGDVPQARGVERRQHQDPVDAGHSRFHGLEPDHRAAVLLGARSSRCRSR